MAGKLSALTTTVTVASNNISNDVLSFSFDTPYGVQEITGLDKSAVERLLLRADCTGSFTFAFNVDASRSHATLKTPGSKTFVIFFGQVATATFTAVTTNYGLNVAEDGSILGNANWALSSGTAVAWT
jgi:hypothetical protein